MIPDVVVRAARGEDLDGVLQVGLRAFPASYAGVVEPEVVQLLLQKWWTKDALVPLIRSGRCFVAVRDEQVVGMASFGNDDGALVLWRLYVDPVVQRRGVGGLLLDAVRAHAAERGERLFFGYTEGNRQARDFTEAHGLVEVRREEQAGMPDLVWMGEPA